MIDVLDVLRETLAPRYAVERLIGVGGMARVYLATFATPQRRDEAGGHLDLERIWRKSGAATVVAGAYYRARDSIHFQVQIMEAASGHVIRALDPVAAPVGSPLGAVETLRRRVAATLDTLIPATPRD